MWKFQNNISSNLQTTAYLIWKGQSPKSQKIEFALKSALHRDGRQYVYRRQNERYRDNYVIESNRHGGGSVMIWEVYPLISKPSVSKFVEI